MRRVRRKDTAPEMAVRKYLHGEGLRYRLHVRGLPGTPDLVFAKYGAVVFVNGCFWHGHRCRHGSYSARTNVRFWQEKIVANRERDKRKARMLRSAGWRVFTVWECRADDPAELARLCRRIRDIPVS